MPLNDPVIQELINLKVEFGKVQTEVKNLGVHLGEKIDNLSVCNNDLDDRVTEQSEHINDCIRRSEFAHFQEKIEATLKEISKDISDIKTKEITDLKVDTGINKKELALIIVFCSTAVSAMVAFITLVLPKIFD